MRTLGFAACVALATLCTLIGGGGYLLAAVTMGAAIGAGLLGAGIAEAAQRAERQR